MEKKEYKQLKPAQENMAERIAGMIIRLQSCWSEWMGKRFERLSAKRKKIVLGCFCFVATVACSWLVLAGLSGEKPVKYTNTLIAVPFQQPRSSLKPGGIPQGTGVNKRNIALSLLPLLDSMERTLDSERDADSTKHLRNELLDSIRIWLK